MKKILLVTTFLIYSVTAMYSQDKNQEKMQKRVINPWTWQDALSYVQAVEVKNSTGTLYVSGQAAVNADGKSSNADMRTQLGLAIENLEKVISEAGYNPKNIVRLTIYSTSSDEFITKCFDLFQDFVARHGMKQTASLVEVAGLNETLKVELEATVVK